MKMVKCFGKSENMFNTEVFLLKVSDWNTAIETHAIGNYIIKLYSTAYTISKLMEDDGWTVWERVFWLDRNDPTHWQIETDQIDGELANLINRLVKTFS